MPVWKGIVGTGFTAAEFAQYAETVAFDAWRPQFVVLHNTAVPAFSDWHQVSGGQRMQNLESYYRDQQKWSAGPHLFVADDLIWVFTALNLPGVHSPSWNAISWGVELVGDYSAEPLSPAVQQNAVSALATLHALLGLDPSQLRLHKEDPKTTHNCPGSNIVKADFQELILEQIGTSEHAPGALV
ncbi:MAG TPA: N-acetylmuramoyl-L-alanine amidase [Candidatus Angelobacter sp.]|nr:N-acetylmuramoyl-L-alanine amidase [Candidatus Angelobacter sp.]